MSNSDECHREDECEVGEARRKMKTSRTLTTSLRRRLSARVNIFLERRALSHTALLETRVQVARLWLQDTWGIRDRRRFISIEKQTVFSQLILSELQSRGLVYEWPSLIPSIYLQPCQQRFTIVKPPGDSILPLNRLTISSTASGRSCNNLWEELTRTRKTRGKGAFKRIKMDSPAVCIHVCNPRASSRMRLVDVSLARVATGRTTDRAKS